MIARITGTIAEIQEDAITIDVGGLGYEVMVPSGLALRLRQHGATGSEITLHTLEYIEGGPSGGAMVPRLIGFLDPLDREFFRMITTVKGLGPKKALKSLTIPTKRFAAAIEGDDASTLSQLPGVGKRSAEKIVAELRGRCQKFALMRGEEALEVSPEDELEPSVRDETMQILTNQLQYSALEAEAMIEEAIKVVGKLETSQQLISEIFRIKAGH
jgi:holliday junction DNA helicase RuvA